MSATMQGIVLPGDSTVAFREFDVPEPGFGQVLIEMKASSICGSDIRAIYREHLGVGPERYQGVIAGHEPCGIIARVGPGCKVRKAGERVVLYHIAGCGNCEECRHGYMINCEDMTSARGAYGWQRNGGHASYLLAEENTCVPLPDNLTYVDGALVACGFGTAWEALTRMQVSGHDKLLITGLGPVGLAAAQLGRALGATQIIGFDINAGRVKLSQDLGLVDEAFVTDDSALEKIRSLTGGRGCEASIDCSGVGAARLLALQGTRTWGRCAFVGEGGKVTFDVSPLLIHQQITLFGSWVTSLAHMEDLLERLSRWNLHPEATVTTRVPLAQAAEAYQMADVGQGGKICITFE